jgi:NADH-quinone oxidoreductase subunit E
LGRPEKPCNGVLLTSDSDSLRERVRRSLESQTRPTVTVLSSLLAAHDELGYLPDEAIEEVAAYNEASINDVWGVASFYTNFRFTPPAERIVEVCWGPTCHLAGATDILLRVQEELGLTDEGETSDNKVTLKYNTCLGACSQAPVMSVDHHLKGRVTADTAGETVGLLRSK